MPWTRNFNPGHALYRGRKHDIAGLAFNNRRDFVLKPADGYGGKDVFIGSDVKAAEWERIINRALGATIKLDYAAKGFRTLFFLALATQEQQASKNIDVGLGNESLDREIDGGEHLGFAHDPPADVFGGGVAQHTVGQNDAQAASTRLKPFDTTLDKENLRSDATLGRAGIAETAFAVWLPVMRQLVLLKNVLIGNRNVRAEGRIGGDDIHRAQRDFFLGTGQIGQMPQRKLQ